MGIGAAAFRPANRFISFFVAVVLVFTSAPLTPRVAEAGDPPPIELVEERTVYSRTYQLPDGSRETEFSLAPLHYPDPATGELLEVDNSLIETQTPTGAAWQNRANRFKVVLPNELGGGLGSSRD